MDGKVYNTSRERIKVPGSQKTRILLAVGLVLVLSVSYMGGTQTGSSLSWGLMRARHGREPGTVP